MRILTVTATIILLTSLALSGSITFKAGPREAHATEAYNRDAAAIVEAIRELRTEVRGVKDEIREARRICERR